MTEGTLNLDAFLQTERTRIETALERALARILPRLPEPPRGPVRQGVTIGGKRLRPILCIEGWRACGGDLGATDFERHGMEPDDLHPIHELAVSLELIHAYSLMHDDLPSMDDAPLRRGLPTPHTTWGVTATTIGGAALIPAAGLEAWRAAARLGLDDETAREIVRTLARAAGAGGMVGGQALDLMGEGRSLDRDELDHLHRAKTGALLTASLRIGALAAGAPSGRVAAIEAYGRAIGLAFQIADDILDATADAAALGKRPSDADLEKSTYVRLLGVDGAREEARLLADEAVAAIDRGGIRTPALEALARYAVERDH